MVISIIVATDKKGVIGKRGGIPWYLPADLKRFKKLTMGHSIIMGRKTFESIGKPLPGRKNIVLTSRGDFGAAGCIIVHSVDEALRAADGKEVFVIGGAEVYREFLPRAKKLYLTRIEADFEGDVFFPPIDMAEWKEISSEEGMADIKNRYPHNFRVFEKEIQH